LQVNLGKFLPSLKMEIGAHAKINFFFQFQSTFLGSSTSVRVIEEVKPEFDKFQQTTKPDL